jgi:hypothetical protein
VLAVVVVVVVWKGSRESAGAHPTSTPYQQLLQRVVVEVVVLV